MAACFKYSFEKITRQYQPVNLLSLKHICLLKKKRKEKKVDLFIKVPLGTESAITGKDPEEVL